MDVEETRGRPRMRNVEDACKKIRKIIGCSTCTEPIFFRVTSRKKTDKSMWAQRVRMSISIKELQRDLPNHKVQVFCSSKGDIGSAVGAFIKVSRKD